MSDEAVQAKYGAKKLWSGFESLKAQERGEFLIFNAVNLAFLRPTLPVCGFDIPVFHLERYSDMK